MKLLGRYKNGNYMVTMLEDGTKIRHTEADEFIPDHAENMDIKINNNCSMECKFCFIEGTKILMSDFSQKNIEDVKVGDEVISFDENVSGKGNTRKINISKVLKTFCHVEDELIKTTTEDGNCITSTLNHPFLSEGTGKDHSRKFNKIERIDIGKLLFTTHFPLKDKINYESDNYKLGYIIGAWCGDGTRSHTIDKNGYDMYLCRFVTKDNEINHRVLKFTNYFMNDMFYLNNFKFSKGKYCVDAVVNATKNAYDTLNKLINNTLFINESKEYACGFLAGFFDSEGNIGEERKIIRMSNTNINYIKEAERCLDMIGLEYVRECRHHVTQLDLYNVRVKGYSGWNKFLWYTRPVCPRKRFEKHIFDNMSYHKTKIIKKEFFVKKQYVYNLETEDHTYIANNFLVHNCHEGSTPNGKLGDIMNEKFINILYPYQEVAIGGGNVLEHPDLIPFLHKLKELKVIANITVNQVHFEHSQELIKKLVDEKLIYGLGVSLVNPTQEFVNLIKQYPNAVIHVINGILKPTDVEMLRDNNLKILILGYKHIRRGDDFYLTNRDDIVSKQKWLYKNLESIVDKFKVVSFDNLAINQLNVRRLMSQEEWDEFYMGDDSEFTYYIDMVERKFAKNSTVPMNQRYDLLDSVDDMFEKIRKR